MDITEIAHQASRERTSPRNISGSATTGLLGSSPSLPLSPGPLSRSMGTSFGTSSFGSWSASSTSWSANDPPELLSRQSVPGGSLPHESAAANLQRRASLEVGLRTFQTSFKRITGFNN
ncbi:hypothetical protein HYH03_018803 [Edaphochlamys debaryana]|uniref:Uncharacterized protein n=1 Tax=Edaphochlamys debaryana TaxID=47281 RepID=A0A836BMS4_9CHLO|nr:hypothetical protein HYH03_018803 [Edaphochlamys debaryana]|eukprot:KAG2482260.1 hypothetical protein HYH03_018803 [Edaphochlamys debaryana]